MDYSPPGSCVRGLWRSLYIYICLHIYAVLCLAAQSCLIFCDPMDCSLPGSSVYGDSPGKNTGVGCHALLQGIFPTQVSKPGLPHCRWILYKLSHQGSPRTLEWVAYPFSRGSSHSRNWIRVSCIAGRFFTSWAMRETLLWWLILCVNLSGPWGAQIFGQILF